VRIANKLFRKLGEFQVIENGIQVNTYQKEHLLQSSGKGRYNWAYWELGLAVCQRLVEEMGGEMSFCSQGEKLGPTVTFAVPVYDGDRLTE